MTTFFMGVGLFLAFSAAIVSAVLLVREVLVRRRLEQEAAKLRRDTESQIRAQAAEVDRLKKQFAETANAARAKIEQAEADARILRTNAERHYAGVMERARGDAALIISAAERKAEEIAGKAYDVVRNAEHYERVATAMRNIIEGYGDDYIIPAESLLDELAEEFGHKEAGQKLKEARQRTKAAIKDGHAAECGYVEAARREGAERFVLDAFNGKVDSILSRVRHDNAGTLGQEIRDAFMIVNHGGKPFRDARVTEEYLAARLERSHSRCSV